MGEKIFFCALFVNCFKCGKFNPSKYAKNFPINIVYWKISSESTSLSQFQGSIYVYMEIRILQILIELLLLLLTPNNYPDVSSMTDRSGTQCQEPQQS